MTETISNLTRSPASDGHLKCQPTVIAPSDPGKSGKGSNGSPAPGTGGPGCLSENKKVPRIAPGDQGRKEIFSMSMRYCYVSYHILGLHVSILLIQTIGILRRICNPRICQWHSEVFLRDKLHLQEKDAGPYVPECLASRLASHVHKNETFLMPLHIAFLILPLP